MHDFLGPVKQAAEVVGACIPYKSIIIIHTCHNLILTILDKGATSKYIYIYIWIDIKKNSHSGFLAKWVDTLVRVRSYSMPGTQ